MNRLKSITLSLILTFFLSIPIFGVANTVNAASFDFDPETNSYPESCNQSINIFADVTGESSNGADLDINYDPNQIEILDSDPNRPGIQVKNGNAYDVYVYNTVDTGIGRIRVAGASFNTALTSRKLYATIEFKGKPGASFVNFQIKVDGFGSTFSLDTNIADSNTNLDLLTSVTNGNYTFTQGACSEDIDGPVHTFIKPEEYGSGYVAQNGVIVKITDFGVGVDITTVVITVDGIDYTYNSPEVTYTGDSDSYTVTIVPTQPYSENTAITAISKASDFAGNTSTKQIVFNIPPGTPISCPVSYVEGEPGSGNFCTPTEERIVTTIFGEDSIIYKMISDIGTPGVTSLLIGLISISWMLPFLNTPLLLFNLLAVYFGRRNITPWGVIVDEISRKPVPFAACRIFKSGTLFAVAQVVSDLEGRYGFTVTEGEYRLEITREGYEKFKYEVVIDKYNRTFGVDVFLKPLSNVTGHGSKGVSLITRLKVFIRAVSPYLFFSGFILSCIAAILYPNIFNWIILFIYILTFIAMVITRTRKKRKTSEVIDSMNKLRIPHAIIKIFDIETGKLIDSMVTNESGMFEFLGEPGEYAMLVSIRGYAFPSSSQLNYDKISDRLLKVSLNRGDNNLKILADPLNDSSGYIVSGNLKSPFN